MKVKVLKFKAIVGILAAFAAVNQFVWQGKILSGKCSIGTPQISNKFLKLLLHVLQNGWLLSTDFHVYIRYWTRSPMGAGFVCKHIVVNKKLIERTSGQCKADNHTR